MNQQIKEKRKQPIRTCIHQPFEYNFRTIDQYKSIELAKNIQSYLDDQELKKHLQIKFGIRSAVRKVRTDKVDIVAIILIMDQNMTDMFVSAATYFWKYKQQIILAKEETRVQLAKVVKIQKLNCVYLYTEKSIELDEKTKQKLEQIKGLMEVYKNESKCEIPIILGEEMKYKTVKLKVPIEQLEQERKYQQLQEQKTNQNQNQRKNQNRELKTKVQNNKNVECEQ